MPRTRINLEKIRAELTWVIEAPDPNKCGCRNVRCCEETGHAAGACSRAVATKFWSFRWEYYCAECLDQRQIGTVIFVLLPYLSLNANSPKASKVLWNVERNRLGFRNSRPKVA